MPFLMVATILLALGLNRPVLGATQPIFLAHLLMTALGGLTVLAMLQHSKTRAVDWCLPHVVNALLFLLFGAAHLIGPVRFAGEWTKLVLLFGSYVVFAWVLSNWAVRFSWIAVAVMGGLLTASVVLVGVTNLTQTLTQLGVASRLGIGDLGGFNTFAFLIAQAFVLGFYLAGLRPFRSWRLLLILAALGYLSLFLVATFSRGGALALVVGSVTYASLSRHRKVLIPTMAAAGVVIAAGLVIVLADKADLLQRYTFSEDASGSGRTDIWAFLVGRLLDHPLALLVGFGPGSIAFQTPITTIYSAHSTYLDIAYQYGLAGVAAALLLLNRTRRALAAIVDTEERAVLTAILAQILAGAAVDSYVSASQVGWVFALWFAVILTRGSQPTQRGALSSSGTAGAPPAPSLV